MNQEKIIPNTLAIMSLLSAYFLSKELWGFLPAVLIATLVYAVAYPVLVVYKRRSFKLLYGILFSALLVVGVKRVSSFPTNQGTFAPLGKYTTMGFSPETYLEIVSADQVVMSMAPFQDTILFTTTFSADSVRFYQDEEERFRWKTSTPPNGTFSLIRGTDSIHFRRVVE